MKKVIKLGGELCANCATKIQDKIGKLSGVNKVSVNALTLKFTLDAEDERFDEILAESERIFNKIEPDCEVLV